MLGFGVSTIAEETSAVFVFLFHLFKEQKLEVASPLAAEQLWMPRATVSCTAKAISATDFLQEPTCFRPRHPEQTFASVSFQVLEPLPAARGSGPRSALELRVEMPSYSAGPLA